jgi:branched-chain amino acid transport system substrate-binding protein
LKDTYRARRRLLAALPAALLLAFSLSCAHAQTLPDRIKLGMLGSVTGPQAGASIANFTGARMAVAEINKAGGIAGKQIDVVMGDDQSNAASAVSEAKRLVFSEKENLQFGPFSSQFTLAVAPVLNDAKIFSISTSGSTALTPALSNYHFSINPPADAQGRAMVVYAQDVLKAKSIGWLGDNGAQSKAALESAKAEAATRGMTFTLVQEFEIGQNDVSPQILSLRRSKPDVLFIFPNTGADHGNIAKAIEEIGWDIKMESGVAPTYLTEAALKVTPNAYKNLVTTGTTALSYCRGDPEGANPYAEFRAKLKAFDPTRYEQLSHATAGWGYDAIYLMKAAVEATRSTDGPTLTAWLEQNAGTLKGVSGAFTSSKTSHFLLAGPKALSMIEDPHKARGDGMVKRAGC